jgi:hypothetical protein
VYSSDFSLIVLCFDKFIGIPRATVEKLYQEYITTSGKDNKLDKKEFRRLYKELYTSGKTGATVPAVISEHDLEKMSDRVFKAFDADGSGKLTFEGKYHHIFIEKESDIFYFVVEFVNAYLLLSQNPSGKGPVTTPHERLAYVLDHNNPTPGKRNKISPIKHLVHFVFFFRLRHP